MKPRETYEDVQIGDRSYRLNKADARTGCWLFSVLASKADSNQKLLSALGNLPHELFDEIQAIAIRHISKFETKDENVLHSALVAPNGAWADKDVADNSSDLMNLTTKWLIFNLSPFLGEP